MECGVKLASLVVRVGDKTIVLHSTCILHISYAYFLGTSQGENILRRYSGSRKAADLTWS